MASLQYVGNAVLKNISAEEQSKIDKISPEHLAAYLKHRLDPKPRRVLNRSYIGKVFYVNGNENLRPDGSYIVDPASRV